MGGSTVFHFSLFDKCAVNLSGFGLHFLMVKDAQSLFMSLVSICLFSSVKCLPGSLAHFQILWVFLLSGDSYVHNLYSGLRQMCGLQIFSPRLELVSSSS